MKRQEFSAKTKVDAFARCGNHCESCTARLGPGNIEYDHIIPCALGGDNDLGNIRVCCRSCHRVKTSKSDMPRIAKAKRNYRMGAGVRKPRTITAWRRFSGELVKAARER